MPVRLKVKEIAEQKGFSQGLLGRKANVDVRTMRKIYRDPHASITLVVLGRLAEALSVDASELIESSSDG
jgi:transcriptional regulator with XRE-family HTH domain